MSKPHLLRHARLLTAGLCLSLVPFAACRDSDNNSAPPPSRVGFPSIPPFALNPAESAFPGDIAPTTSIAAADVDGDMDLDVLVGNSGAPSALYLAEDGRFVRAPSGRLPALEGNPSCLSFVDINGDGVLDVFVGHDEIKQASTLIGDGKGGFTTGSLRGPTQVRAILPVDVDGDTDLDLVFARGNSQPNRLWINRGNGNWTEERSQLPSDANGSNAIAALDIDGDRDLDLVFGNDGGDTLYRNDGAGSFTAATATLRSRVTNAIVTGDINADQKLDLILGGVGAHTVLLGDGAGGLSDASLTWLPSNSAETRALALVDLDGDQDLDLVAANYGSPSQVYRHGGARWMRDSGAGLRALPEFATSALARDVDGDSDLDLIVGVQNGATLLYRNNGSGKFTEASRSSSLGVTDTAMVASDVDGDGDVDLVAPRRGTILLSQGAAGFAARPNARATDVTHALASDLDGDGDEDLFLARIGRNAIWINDGKGSFSDQSQARLPGKSANSQIAVAFDADGDMDLDLFVGELGFGAQLLLNDGKGSFADASASVSSLQGITEAVAGDLDGDGDEDLIVGGASVATRVLRNDGRGVFAIEAAVSNAGTRGLAIGDVDGDDDLDAISAGVDGSANRLLRNDGGTLTLDSLPQRRALALGAKLVDIEGDVDLDAIFPGNTTPVLLNDGKGIFADATTAFFPDPGLASRDILVTDVDADQDADFVVIGDAGTTIFYNLQSHLATSGAVRGTNYEWTIYSKTGLAPAGQFAIPYMRFGPRQAPFRVPPFGTWFLGANPFVILDAQTIPSPAGRRTLSFVVPDDPVLAGLEISNQALLLPELGQAATWRLSNPVFDTIQ